MYLLYQIALSQIVATKHYISPPESQSRAAIVKPQHLLGLCDEEGVTVGLLLDECQRVASATSTAGATNTVDVVGI
jgi:hypothetical protein